jgi:hypothetical protein
VNEGLGLGLGLGLQLLALAALAMAARRLPQQAQPSTVRIVGRRLTALLCAVAGGMSFVVALVLFLT